jgi:hypothetical protein
MKAEGEQREKVTASFPKCLGLRVPKYHMQTWRKQVG